MDFLPNLLILADDAKKAAEGAPVNPLIAWAPIILIVVLFYFMILAPQKRQQREHDNRVDNLRKNDEILTRGGIFGKIVSIGSEGRIVIRIDDNARMTIHKNAVAQVLSGDAPVAGTAADTQPNETQQDAG